MRLDEAGRGINLEFVENNHERRLTCDSSEFKIDARDSLKRFIARHLFDLTFNNPNNFCIVTHFAAAIAQADQTDTTIILRDSSGITST